MTQQPISFPLSGGLDLITPALGLIPGRVVAALNYEPVMSGYKRISGYERFDGQTAPSTATVVAVHFIQGTAALGALVAGSRITQGSTGPLPSAAGFLVAPPVLESGSFAAGDATGWLYVVPSSGLFADAQPILTPTPAGVQAGPVDTAPVTFGPYDGDTLKAEAANRLRSVILPVPGAGPVRGIWFSENKAYAVRDNVGGTAGIPYYSVLDDEEQVGNLEIGGETITVAGEPIVLVVIGDGWIEAASELVLSFTAGTFQPGQGITITQAGGASAEVRRIIIDSGTFTAGTAAGRAYVVNKVGTFTAGQLVKVGATNAFTSSGDAVANAFPPGGRYSFITENFYGATNQRRVYGVNGVGKAFEFDGTSIIEISTGMPVDTPTRIAEHKGSLFLAFPGGSVQFSEVGEPRQFNAVLGAGELGIGDEITDFLSVPDALGVLGASSVHMLYGTDKDTYELRELSDEAGGLAWTAQRIGQPVYLDNRGLRDLTATSAYGNFKTGTLSGFIEPLLSDLRRDGVDPTASLIVRSKSQYWLFFRNGTALVFLFGKKQVEALPVNLGVVVTCAASVEDNGAERIFIGADDGFVYEMDRGVSFDGRVIEHYLRLPFNNFGSPQVLKRAHKVTMDMEATGRVTLDVSVDIELGAQPGEEAQRLVVTPGSGAIDGLGSNELYFASQIETVAEAYFGIAARNFSLKIAGASAIEEAHVLTAVTYHISARGLRR